MMQKQTNNIISIDVIFSDIDGILMAKAPKKMLFKINLFSSISIS